MKQVQSDPWTVLAEKYPVGTVVNGKIRNLTEFGAFLEIEEGFDGLIHVSDISWTGRIKNPSEVYKKGDAVEAKVLKIDQATRRVSLGVKQVNDIWSSWFEKHKVGDLVRGKVSRVTTFGAFVDLAEGIEGLCHISEIDERRGKGDKADAPPRPGVRQSGLLDPGRDYEFKIVKISQDQHKIGLSYRGAQKQAERRDMDDYRVVEIVGESHDRRCDHGQAFPVVVPAPPGRNVNIISIKPHLVIWICHQRQPAGGIFPERASGAFPRRVQAWHRTVQFYRIRRSIHR